MPLAFHFHNYLQHMHFYESLLWLLAVGVKSFDLRVKWFFFSWGHNQATGRRLPSSSQVKSPNHIFSLPIVFWELFEIKRKTKTFNPGGCKSWLSKVRPWSVRPGTLSSPFCLPSMMPCLRLLPSRTTWEINFVSGCLECSMRSGSLPVSSPFLDLLSGRPFRYGYIKNLGIM